jgi:hypothetical protein
MVAAFFSVMLAVSVGLIVHLHGNRDHWPALGAWAKPLEYAAIVSCVFMAIAVGRYFARAELAGRRLRLGFFILVLAWASGLFHVYEQGASYYTLIIATGVAALLVAFGPAIARRLGARRVAAIDVVLVNLCVLLLGAELGLRVTARFIHSPLLRQESTDAADWLEANRLKPGALRFGFPANSRGYYDDELVPNHGCLVTAVGDSFTVGVVPHEYHFASVAARALGCPIDQIGVCAVGPEEYAIMLRDDALPLGPDVVVLDLFVGNDIVENLRGRDHFRNGMRRWLDRDNTLVYQLPRRLAAIARARRRGYAGTGDPNSASAAPATALSHDEVLRQFPWVTDPLQEPPSLAHDWFMDMETRHARETCGGDDEGSYALFYEILSSMQARVRKAGKKLVVLLIPDEFQVEDPMWSEVSARLKMSLERDRPQRLLAEALRRYEIPFLDILPALRNEPKWKDGWRHLYHRDDSHLNTRGNAIAGAALAEFLRPMLPPH